MDNSLRGIGELRRIRVKYSQSDEAENKIISEIRSKVGEEDNFYKLIHLNLVAERLAYSLGDAFYSEYKNYISTVRDYIGLMLAPADAQKEKELNLKLASSAAKLHNMMTEKLISIRDTEAQM